MSHCAALRLPNHMQKSYNPLPKRTVSGQMTGAGAMAIMKL